LVREGNEDRFFIDDEHGIFAVVDGVGGNAAGETAAEVAIDVLRSHLANGSGCSRESVREAITAANNEIYQRAAADEALHGMACVLTLAAVRDDKVLVGHVGDSRLYLVWNGAIRKLTSDHSPVGEQEERGELTESEAMRHPRRHEVFRDVGARPRTAEEEFVDVKEFALKPDAAILICSDGLSDVLTAAQINQIVELYDGDPDRTARELVDAANAASGGDNVTAIFVAGADFLGAGSAEMAEARERHAITRARPGSEDEKAGRSLRSLLTGRVAFLIYGLLIGLLLALRFR
jgi:serine/threonine protein phosphatase PrpC